MECFPRKRSVKHSASAYVRQPIPRCGIQITQLPKNVTLHIFSHLPLKNKIIVSRVCREWYMVALLLWQNFDTFDDYELDAWATASRLRGDYGIFCVNPSCSCIGTDPNRRWQYLDGVLMCISARVGDRLRNVHISHYRQVRVRTLENFSQSCPLVTKLELTQLEIAAYDENMNMCFMKNFPNLKTLIVEFVRFVHRTNMGALVKEEARKVVDLVLKVPPNSLRVASVRTFNWSSLPSKSLLHIAKQQRRLETFCFEGPVKSVVDEQGCFRYLPCLSRLILNFCGGWTKWEAQAGFLVNLDKNCRNLKMLWLLRATLSAEAIILLAQEFESMTDLGLLECSVQGRLLRAYCTERKRPTTLYVDRKMEIEEEGCVTVVGGVDYTYCRNIFFGAPARRSAALADAVLG